MKQNRDKMKLTQPVLVSRLEQLPDRTFVLSIKMRGEFKRFEGKTLLPPVSKKIKWILVRTIPKEIPATVPGGESRYDMADPEYQKKKVEDSRLARALTLWHGLGPEFWGADSADLEDSVILDRIEGQDKLDDTALDALWEEFSKPSVEQLTDGEKKELQERINFTSGSKSQNG